MCKHTCICMCTYVCMYMHVWVKGVMAHVPPRALAAGQDGHGQLDCTHPHGTTKWLLGSEKQQNLALGMGKGSSWGLPKELAGKSSWVLGPHEAGRSLVLDTADATGCHKRSEDGSVGPEGWALAQGLRKRRWGELWMAPMGMKLSLA